jgi:imidazolonepropionase-like amidohydrolase
MGRPLLIHGATVVDADGERPADVLVHGGRIAAVGDVPGGDHEVLAAQGRFLTPGLIDCHVHLVADAGPDITSMTRRGDAELALLALAHAQRTLRGGVTTLRDTGGYRFAEVAARDAIARGTVQGPRVLVSGHLLTTKGGHGHFMGRQAQGREELVEAAREQLRGGADWVKVIATGGVLTAGADPHASQFRVEEVRAVVEEARRAGRQVAAHAHGAGGIEAAVEGGAASVEHGTYLTDPLAERMRQRGTFLVPTAAAHRGIVEAGTAKGVPEEAVRKAQAALASHREAVQRALAKGVPLAMGTDAGTPFNAHGDNARELELMVEYGLKPEQALAMATVNPARLLRLDAHVGLVRPGMAADLLLLERSPLDDIAAFRRRLARVMLGGAWVA